MPPRNAPALGQALKYFREREGLSQAELARRAGIDHSYVSQLENGRRRNASFEIIGALARVLGTTSNEIYLLAGAGPDTQSNDRVSLPVEAEKVPFLQELSQFAADDLSRLVQMGRVAFRRDQVVVQRREHGDEDESASAATP